MRGLSPALVVMLAGVALFVGAGVAWATAPSYRGGQAIRVKPKPLVVRIAPTAPGASFPTVSVGGGSLRYEGPARGGEAR